MKQLPVEYENRMKKLLGEEFDAYKEALEQEPVKAFRVNTDKITLEEFEKNNPFRYALLIGFYTGLRIGEVYALTWDDIDLENKTLLE